MGEKTALEKLADIKAEMAALEAKAATANAAAKAEIKAEAEKMVGTLDGWAADHAEIISEVVRPLVVKLGITGGGKRGRKPKGTATAKGEASTEDVDTVFKALSSEKKSTSEIAEATGLSKEVVRSALKTLGDKVKGKGHGAGRKYGK